MGRSSYFHKSGDRRTRESSQNTQTNSSPSLFQTLKEGFGLGIGVSVANQIVGRTFDNVLGARTVNIETVSNKQDNYKCKDERESYEQCLKKGLDCSNINEYKEKYEQCLKN